MEYVTLKNSDLKVSRICMGGCPLGEYGWGKVQEEKLLRAIETAVDSGVTMFDTADTYGLGKSEENLGRALASHRKDVVIASKFGVRVENGHTFYDNSPEWIRTAVERSLRRLRTDYIDLYQVHYRDGHTPIATVIDTLEELKQAGKIRHYGLSNVHEADLEELKHHVGSFVSFQNEYSLACRKNEADMFRLSKDLNMTPLTWGSLGQGILTGKYDRTCTFGGDDRRSREVYVNFHGEKLEKNLRIVDAMREIARDHGKSVSAVAIRFILDHLPGSVVLCGAKSPEQIRGNVESMDWHLTEAERNTLAEISA